MHINGLTIGFSDGIKTADYAPPRTVSLTANTAPPEGTDIEAHVAEVLAMLKRRCHVALHGIDIDAPVARQLASIPQPEAAPAPAPRTRRTQAQIAADKAAAEAAASTGSGGGGSTSGDEFPAEEPKEPAAPVVAGDEWGSGPVAVDDAALTKAVTEKNGALQAGGMSAEAAPVLIRELIATYNPDPTVAFALREIPADKRGDFLSKLAAIKPKAA